MLNSAHQHRSVQNPHHLFRLWPLFITLNTVARHVGNIFSKIGSSNRTEAATYANRIGLA